MPDNLTVQTLRDFAGGRTALSVRFYLAIGCVSYDSCLLTLIITWLHACPP